MNLTSYASAAVVRLARLAGMRISAYRIFSAAVQAAADGEVEIVDTAPGRRQLRLLVDGAIVSSCTLWSGASYRDERGYFPLADDEAELVFLETPPAHRGRGHASVLLRAALAASTGNRRLYARIWHSNAASIRAFRKAGWVDCGTRYQRVASSATMSSAAASGRRSDD
jgi:RimJ/RimL family protein N-acetyltransferase